MTTHTFNLAQEPFDSIKEGRKIIESRLYDEKRQSIQLGDQIIFTNRDNPELKIHARVIGLLRYQSFRELFSNYDPSKFGGESISFLIDQIKQFYSDEEEIKYGVLGIQIKTL